MRLTLMDRHSHFSACAQQKFSLNGVTPSILPSVSLSPSFLSCMYLKNIYQTSVRTVWWFLVIVNFDRIQNYLPVKSLGVSARKCLDWAEVG